MVPKFPLHARFFLGWHARPIRMDLLISPKVPGNYKDKDVIDRYLKQMKQKQQEAAKFVPGVATLSDVVLLDTNGEVAFEKEGVRVGEVATDLLGFLKGCRHEQSAPIFGDDQLHRNFQNPCGGAPFWLVSLYAQTFLRIFAYDLLALDYQPGLSLLNLLQDKNDQLVFDVYNQLCTADMRQHMDFNAFVRLLLPDLENLEVELGPARQMALTAIRLWQRIGSP